MSGLSDAPSSRHAAAGAFVIAASLVLALVVALVALSYLLSIALDLPPSLGLPPAAGLAGLASVVAGLSLAAWTFSVRSPAHMMMSTYVTLTKALKRGPAGERAGRTEPLVVSGPQKYMRNPLYFGVVMIVLGWAIIAASPFLLLAALVFLTWFALVLIPYEERELRALFGEEWVRYAAETPMLVPFTKRRKPARSGSGAMHAPLGPAAQ